MTTIAASETSTEARRSRSRSVEPYLTGNQNYPKVTSQPAPISCGKSEVVP